MNLNTVTIIGHVTTQPIAKEFEKGKFVTSFSVATTERRRKGKDGETEFHSIVAFGKLAEICKEYVSKGRLVYISGRIKTSKWQDEKGQNRHRTQIIANEMLLLDKQQALVSAVSYIETDGIEAKSQFATAVPVAA